jgi:hypothetical protein
LIYIFDCEVFAHDWLFCFKNLETGEWLDFHNDNFGVQNFIDSLTPTLCGFNCKHYDSFILKAVLGGFTPEEVKAVNDFIIAEGRNGWEYPGFQNLRTGWFDQIDLMDDMQAGLSLKAIEGHLGMDIRESDVDFDIDHPLSAWELDEVIAYCHADVEATEKLYHLREPYICAKIDLGRLSGLSDEKAAYMTNAKLTAAYLHAQPPAEPYTDEREYDYPLNLRRSLIPEEVFDFFERMKDKSIPDDELWSSSLDIEIGGCPARIAYGGIHGALPCYQEVAAGTRIIRNYDVASLYPSLMIRCGYTSRNIPDPKLFEDTFNTRLEAKRSGNKVLANTLKLVLNTTYGAMLNQYNPLYDPLMGRSVCISGQLFLTELATRYVQEIKSLRLIQINTDGIMVSLEEAELSILYAINEEWQNRTKFLLEEDCISKIVQKDVNNYVMVTTDGKTKTKGGYLTYGIAPAGAFNINNNIVAVKKALIEYFVNGTPVEDTIRANNNIADFQMIAKVGSKYTNAYQIIHGDKLSLQRVNRVYATDDEGWGTLYKTHRETGRDAKIESLPEHCRVDNTSVDGNSRDGVYHRNICEIDKNWYIALAQKRVNDFLGIKEEKKGRKKKMADNPVTTPEAAPAENPKPKAKKAAPFVIPPANVYTKLLDARMKFLDAGVKKSGINRHLEFCYFELEDIVPVSTRIFAEVGLLPMVNFPGNEAEMAIINVDEPEEVLIFRCEMPKLEPNKGTNPVQAMGAAQTYMRRYLYMMALDIVEADSMDANAGNPTAMVAAPKPPAPPPTAAQREEIKGDLTKDDAPADDIQIQQLKKGLERLRELDPSKEEAIQQIAVQTVGFTMVSRKDCADLLITVGNLIAAAEQGS